MLSSCTLVSCTSSLSHNSQPVLRELGTKAKQGGFSPQNPAPQKPSQPWGAWEPPGDTGTAPATAAQGWFCSAYETRQTWDTQIKSPRTEGDTEITTDRARGCRGDEGTLALVSTELLLLGTGQDRRAGCPCRTGVSLKDRGVLGGIEVSLKDKGVPAGQGCLRRTGVSCKDKGVPKEQGCP